MAKSSFELFVIELTKLLLPLKYWLSADQLPAFMRQLNWDLQWPPGFEIDLKELLEVEAAFNQIDFEQPFEEQLSQYKELFNKSKNCILTIVDVGKSFKTLLPSLPDDFVSKIGKHIFVFLLCNYLKKLHPIIYYGLIFLGLIKSHREYNPNTFSYSEIHEINWDNFVKLINNFDLLMKYEYAWNDPDHHFNGQKFLNNLQNIMLACNVPARYYDLSPVYAEYFYKELSKPSTPCPLIKELRIPLIEISDEDTGYTELGFSLFNVRDKSQADSKIKGFAVAPYLEGDVCLHFNLSNNLKLMVSGDIKTGIAITVLPSKVDVEEDIYGTGIGFDGRFMVELSHIASEGKIIVLGEPGKSRFEYEKLSARLQLIISDEKDLVIETELSYASIIIQGSDGDGFLQKILPKDPVRLDFDFTMGLSRNKGIYFKAGAGLEYTFHVNKSFGPIFIKTVDLKLDAKDDGIILITGASGSAKIGPVTATVRKIGLETILDFTKPGLLGNADFLLGFKPPSSIGLTIDAEGVKGGGFLEIEDGNYAGVLELDIQDKVSITAIGILTTKMPDGRTDIFSLKVLGFAEFPPIQLGWGFVLTGLGLAVAIECCMNEEALRTAVYNGSLRSILFPPDPVTNAQQIITDLNNFFPPKNDYYVFGAMVKLGWGGATPLVKADVGIFMELGGPLRIALAGIAHAELPTEDSPIIVLKLQILGILDLGDKTLAIDSSLTGSKLLSFALDGDIALRSSWGDNPRFALSAGGFYPGYRIPPGFPALRKLSITLGSGNPRIGLFLYMATTENSVQFGAALLFHWQKRIKVWFINLGLIEIDGALSFDALFQFNPFYFECKMQAWLSLKRNGKTIMGIDIRLTLTGPNNYHAIGYAKAKVLGVKVKVEFDKRFGDKKPELPQPVISPLKALKAELQEPKNWRVTSPSWGSDRIVFREDIDTENCVDPFGGIVFRQKSVPLDHDIEKFGQAAIPEEEDYFNLIAGEENLIPDTEQSIEDFFAPAEFKYLNDQEKISCPPFEKMKSGLQFSSNHITAPIEYIEDKVMKYETKEYKEEEKIHKYKKIEKVLGKLMPSVLNTAQKIVGQRVHNRLNFKPLSAKKDRITVSEQKFTIATSEAVQGRFKRAKYKKNGEEQVVENLTYAQASQMKDKIGSAESEVLDVAKAIPEEV
jgi:hypothetical protein